ncbi:MAG: DUF5103 domain-containing protein [Cytophagia bacterium]|nr:DUF5103 domain-containing protein [Cytophagia bacterium]
MIIPNWRHRLHCIIIGLLMLNPLLINALGSNPGPAVYQDQIWGEDIHSVRLHSDQDPFGSPVWELGSENPPLMLRFDDLAGGYQPYTVRLIPCRRDWTASDLFEAQAMEGIGQELIQQHRSSFNTLEQYTHYSHPVPSEVLRPKVSGNFAVVVYADQDLQEIVLTRRLLVLENRVSVSALVRQQWTYRGQPELVFQGNNEYRAVDLRTVRAPGRRISKIIRTVDGYQAWVENDQSRASQAHLSQRDLNGRSLIQNFEQRTPHTESEYVWTTFALEPRLNENWSRVYLQGDFGQSACDESMAMEWQEESGLYVKSLYLKQGFYDYRYRTGESPCEAISIEGSHSDTENDYEILVYYHPPAGMAYDRLVGYTKVNSMGQKSR